MTEIVLDITTFRGLFAAFSVQGKYPDTVVQMRFGSATLFISDVNSGCSGMRIDQQTYALYLMTAHLMFLADLTAKGQTGGVLTGATIDKVSVSLEPPPSKNEWQYWLNLSPYGRELLAMLSVMSVGGFYFGGRPELGAFRKVGGVY